MLAPVSKAKSVTDPERFTLLRSFSLLSLLCISIFSLVLGYLVTGFVERNMLERDGALTRDFVASIAEAENFTTYFRNQQRGIGDPEKEEFFKHIATMPDVIRANLYDASKTVLWSSDKALLGRRFPDNDELDEALRGHVVIESEADENREHVKTEHERLTPDAVFVENYVPIRASDDGTVIGVVEFYREPRALFETIAKGRALVWKSTVLGGILLYAALFWTVRRGDRIMRKQQRLINEAQTMASLGELASMVAHNVRNPLASIRSSAELAQELGSLDRHAASDIVSDVDRVEVSLRQVLAYATPNAGQGVQASINDLLRDAANDVTGNRAIQLDLDLDDSLPPVRGDPVLLSQAIKSLMTNSLDAMPTGGRLVLRTCPSVVEGFIEASISDTGSGIPQPALARVFDAFFTTKPKGMGLGLPLARAILRRCDGDIHIRSVPSQGTCVTLHLHTV